MAGVDIPLTYDDCPDDQTDEGFEQGDCPSSRTPGDDASLRPLLRVLKYAHSTDFLDRRWVSKVVQDIFRTAPADILTMELSDIMKVLTEVSNDGLYKIDVLENVPNIASQARDNSDRVPALQGVIGDYLIPLVVRNLGCSDAGADKKAQTVLIQMIEMGYVTKFHAEIKICPSILALTKMDQLEVNTGAVMLMSKLAHLLGKDITERILLKRFIELCSSHLFHIRKIAASQFGHYCAVVDKDTFEKTLLPSYLALCQDEIGGVRKSCAEVVTYVSCVCPPDLRRTLLAVAFDKLLQDECRWVKISAFQTLGTFISTFADPVLTHIGYNASGELVLFNQNDTEFHPGGQEGFSDRPPMHIKEDELFSVMGITWAESFFDLDPRDTCQSDAADTSEGSNERIQTEGSSSDQNTLNVPKGPLDLVDTGPVHQDPAQDEINNGKKHEDDLLSYNEYNYWYISPPDVDLEVLGDGDINVAPAEDLSESLSEDIVTNHLEELCSALTLNNDLDSANGQNESIQPTSDIKGDNLDNNKNSDVNTVNSSTIEVKEPPQKIVPQDLIDKYVWMSNSEPLYGIDMPFFCAYSLPGVVLTLGKDNWPLLKNTMEELAGHRAYKVRRTVAYSLHEIAWILGPEIAMESLTPLFEGFLKDLDEVRIGILNNLFHFLELISPEKRVTFLPKLSQFFRVDNACNWRFEKLLAIRLTECVQLFRPADVVKHIGLYAQALMLHNVAAVRQGAMTLVTEIVSRISKDHGLASSYLSVIAERFAHSKKWKPRQTFALLCSELLQQDAIDLEEFSTVMLPHLLDLSWDPVPNVRLVVARCIGNQLIKKDYFVDPSNEHIESLNNVLRRLQADKDRDVRMFADAATVLLAA